MANTVLTPTMVTREIQRILHQKCNFIGSINRQYDDSFAKNGAKIGTDLKIRLPNQYTVRTGAVMDVQNTTESSVTLTVATMKGVDLNFSSSELTLSLDDFSKRILDPAISVLAANVENDAKSMYKNVYQAANESILTNTLSFDTLVDSERRMTNALVPTSNRTLNLNTRQNAEFVSAAKGLFHASDNIEKQYREGMMGRTLGYDVMRNTIWGQHTSGSDVSAYQVNGPNQTGATVTINTGSGTFKQGDIVTLAGCNRVHPETKADTGELMQFVVTADVAGSATSLPISPSIIITGATQNVAAAPTDTGAVTKVGGASKAYDLGLAYHEDAFAFVTADLELPQGVDFARREVLDNISMRIVRQYTINNDQFPCRVDVLYGYKAIRPELACRVHSHSN